MHLFNTIVDFRHGCSLVSKVFQIETRRWKCLTLPSARKDASYFCSDEKQTLEKGKRIIQKKWLFKHQYVVVGYATINLQTI